MLKKGKGFYKKGISAKKTEIKSELGTAMLFCEFCKKFYGIDEDSNKCPYCGK
jgi:Zn finger protein HypA/HybF involved in hydrogenase expression